MSEITSVNLSAMINSQASWAKVARKLYLSLKKITRVNLLEQKGFLYDEDKILFKNTMCKKDSVKYSDIDIIFDYPGNIKKKGKGKLKVYHFVYEFEYLSEEWKQNIKKYADLIWVPNEFNKKILRGNGIYNPCIVIPYGTEQLKRKFNKDELIKRFKIRPFVFTSVLMPQKRKGIDILLKAFSYEFEKEKDVVLKLKIPYSVQKCSWDLNIQSLIKKYFDYENIIFDDRKLTDEEMMPIIECSQMYLQPSLSEGFGLSVLDSLISGIPVMVNDYGGQLDFSSARKGMIVLKSKKKNMQNVLYSEPGKNIEVNVPVVKDLRVNLRRFKENFEFYYKLYNEIDIDVKKYTWDNCAERLLREIIRFKSSL